MPPDVVERQRRNGLRRGLPERRIIGRQQPGNVDPSATLALGLIPRAPQDRRRRRERTAETLF
jgi:hypothetical protein